MAKKETLSYVLLPFGKTKLPFGHCPGKSVCIRHLGRPIEEIDGKHFVELKSSLSLAEM